MRCLVVLVAACATAPAPPTNSAPSDPDRARYIGTTIGIEIHEIGMPSHGSLHLPNGLAKLGVVNTATSHLVIARRGDALVLLVTDDAGVITDDLAIPGVADGHVVVPGCAEEAFLGLVAKADCPTAQGTATARAAWNLSARLTPVTPPPACGCDMLHLGE
jgi:hypothetical protein